MKSYINIDFFMQAIKNNVSYLILLAVVLIEIAFSPVLGTFAGVFGFNLYNPLVSNALVSTDNKFWLLFIHFSYLCLMINLVLKIFKFNRNIFLLAPLLLFIFILVINIYMILYFNLEIL